MTMAGTSIGSIKGAAKNLSALVNELNNIKQAIEEASSKRDKLMGNTFETITLQFGPRITCNVSLNPNDDEIVAEKIKALVIEMLSRRAESGIAEIKRLALLLAEAT